MHPQDRVAAFLADFAREHTRIRPLFDDWRLDQVKTTYPGASAKAIPAGEARKRLALADPSAPLAPLRSDDRADPGTLFAGREVVGIGTFETSGVLAAGDFGHDLPDQPVLSRSVPAGACTGEYVIDQGVVAALRVRFSDEPVATWALAESQGGHVVGVDSGTVGVIDFTAAAQLTVTGKENAADKAFEAGSASVLRSRKGAFGVQVTSGWGDGAYPVYWGVGVDGTPVQVVVDLLVIPA